jgi:serine phosphatase RsbU (regulator of sigma subunit)
MANVSLTASESFRLRAQSNEARRVLVWIAVLVAMLIITVLRHVFGGIVMTKAEVFVPTTITLVVAIIVELVLYRVLRRANRGGYLLPNWLWRASAVFDLLVPMTMLMISSLFSPRGPIPPLSAPPVWMFTFVIVLSILRLRPKFTLGAGLAAASYHFILALRALAITHQSLDQYPVLLSYSAILALLAIAAMIVAHDVKQHVLEAVAEAKALEEANARVIGFQKDLSVARDIQQGLLPSTSPKIDGFDIAGFSRPAEMAGGDYFDWQELPDGRLITVLADVTGHGIGPALVMAVCRAYARASAVAIREPQPLMERINHLLRDDLPSDRFITLAIAMLQKTGAVELLSAGHGPTFLYHAANGTITHYHGDGLPLGVNPDEVYEPTSTFQMESGDILLLMTDGFFEWPRGGDGEAFGIERCADALRSAATSDAKSILKALDGAVRHFVDGSKQVDDVTAVVIKRR